MVEINDSDEINDSEIGQRMIVELNKIGYFYYPWGDRFKRHMRSDQFQIEVQNLDRDITYSKIYYLIENEIEKIEDSIVAALVFLLNENQKEDPEKILLNLKEIVTLLESLLPHNAPRQPPMNIQTPDEKAKKMKQFEQSGIKLNFSEDEREIREIRAIQEQRGRIRKIVENKIIEEQKKHIHSENDPAPYEEDIATKINSALLKYGVPREFKEGTTCRQLFIMLEELRAAVIAGSWDRWMKKPIRGKTIDDME